MSENSKLTAQQQALVDQVLKNLEEGAGLWKQGWIVTGAPQSATTGKRYRGLNNFFLTLAAMREGYKDNRWAAKVNTVPIVTDFYRVDLNFRQWHESAHRADRSVVLP